eukprot:gene19065-biopygen22363
MFREEACVAVRLLKNGDIVLIRKAGVHVEDGDAAVPETLRLISTTSPKTYGGFYSLIPDRQVNGMPMWECGKNRLYSRTNGQWMVTYDEKDMATDVGGISSAQHGGLMPDAVAIWKNYDGKNWQEDAGVSVTNGEDATCRKGHPLQAFRNPIIDATCDNCNDKQ